TSVFGPLWPARHQSPIRPTRPINLPNFRSNLKSLVSTPRQTLAASVIPTASGCPPTSPTPLAAAILFYQI
ncbi:hypothetical protein Taro_034246, partial [Colocasia esculenta]|nr:hypothetical protein [Colocasia esculenta]